MFRFVNMLARWRSVSRTSSAGETDDHGHVIIRDVVFFLLLGPLRYWNLCCSTLAPEWLVSDTVKLAAVSVANETCAKRVAMNLRFFFVFSVFLGTWTLLRSCTWFAGRASESSR